MDKQISTHNAKLITAARSGNLSLGRRDQNQWARASSVSPTSNKSRPVTSGNSSGGNSSYFQTGSTVRSLHIAKNPSFLNSRFAFTLSPLVTTHSMRFPRLRVAFVQTLQWLDHQTGSADTYI